jgi:hypothetical protein
MGGESSEREYSYSQQKDKKYTRTALCKKRATGPVVKGTGELWKSGRRDCYIFISQVPTGGGSTVRFNLLKGYGGHRGPSSEKPRTVQMKAVITGEVVAQERSVRKKESLEKHCSDC